MHIHHIKYLIQSNMLSHHIQSNIIFYLILEKIDSDEMIESILNSISTLQGFEVQSIHQMAMGYISFYQERRILS